MERQLLVPQRLPRMVAAADAVELSIIVAAEIGGPRLRRCLSALKPQLCVGKIEVNVVNGSARDLRAAGEFEGLQILKVSEGTSVPALWEAGIEAARGRIVALTIEQCVPQSDWVAQVLRTHSGEHSVIGGAIEPGPELTLTDWAVYFCRYNRYMLPASAEFVDDVAGDNCSYKRAALGGLQDVLAQGFWETFVHDALRQHGEKILYDPSVVVFYGGGIPGGRFLVRRFRHGRYFATRRGRQMGIGERLARALTSPAVPFLLLQRIAGRVWRQKRYRGRFLVCLPLILAFLVSWSLGEGLGYLLDGRVDAASEKPSEVSDRSG